MKSTHLTQAEAQAIVDSGMEAIFSQVAFARAFHTEDGPAGFDSSYYKRHVLECVLRINLNNELDARAISTTVNADQILAKDFSYYLYDELGHDELFYADLKAMGMTRADVDSAEVFFSTKLLMGWLDFEVRKHGALPAVLWDWFLEYYGDRYNRFITTKAAKQLGRELTKGAASHLNTDETEDHVGLMFRMVQRVVKTEKDAELAREVLKRAVELVGVYFQELFDATLGQKKAA